MAAVKQVKESLIYLTARIHGKPVPEERRTGMFNDCAHCLWIETSKETVVVMNAPHVFTQREVTRRRCGRHGFVVAARGWCKSFYRGRRECSREVAA